MGECLSCKREPELERWPAGPLELSKNLVVSLRRDDHQNVVKVFRRGAHHARSADVDLLDELVETDAGPGGGLFERVQIDCDDLDRLNAELRNRAHIVGMIPPREDTRMDLRMKRLDAAV